MDSLIARISSLKSGVNYENESISILLYADDIVLMAETEHNLQKQITALEEWTKENKIKINMDKTKIMHFRNSKKKITKFKFTLSDTEIEKSNSYKYLGLELNEQLNYTYTTEKLAKKGSQSLGQLLA